MKRMTTRFGSRRPGRPGRPGQEGFSLLEGLIATALLLFVVLGILPLFSQSMLNNVAGRDATTSSNMGTDTLERNLQMGMFSEDLTFASGNALRLYELITGGDAEGEIQETVRAEITETARPNANDYETAFSGAGWTVPPQTGDWGRITTVRYFGLAALGDNVLNTDEQLEGGSSEIKVHLKEVEVTVLSGLPEAGALVSATPVTSMRVLKAF